MSVAQSQLINYDFSYSLHSNRTVRAFIMNQTTRVRELQLSWIFSNWKYFSVDSTHGQLNWIDLKKVVSCIHFSIQLNCNIANKLNSINPIQFMEKNSKIQGKKLFELQFNWIVAAPANDVLVRLMLTQTKDEGRRNGTAKKN